MRIPLLYALHSGNLYGTERMALATAEGLTDSFAPVIFAPPGPALEEAARLDFAIRAFQSPSEFAWQLRPFLATHRRLAFVATGVVHSLACGLWNAMYRRAIVHLHMIHGGTDERLSYGRKKFLKHLGVRFVAVSAYVKERLVANGVPADRTSVIENFLSDARVSEAPRRGSFAQPGVRQVVVISRVDPIKRLDVLLDALDRRPELRQLSIRILGTGWDFSTLQARAAQSHPNVCFAGFQPDVASELATADLLVHCCPVEPFGLAILEAMAAGVPVLVPDTGGAGSLVEDGVSGFRFAANNADALATQLSALLEAPVEQLNRIVARGSHALTTRFSACARLADYHHLLKGGQL